MAQEFLLSTQIAAALIMLGLAGVLFAFRYEHRASRAFSFFLVVRGLLILSNQLNRLGFWRGPQFWEHFTTYLHLATVPALVYFAASYRPRTPRAARWIILGVAALVEIVYAFDHSLAYERASNGRLVTGPLFPLVAAVPLAYALIAYWLAGGDSSSGRPLGAHTWVSAGFLVNAIVESSLVVVAVAARGWAAWNSAFAGSSWHLVGYAALPVALLISAATVFRYVQHARGDAAHRPTMVRLVILCVVSPLVALLFEFETGATGFDEYFALSALGVWRLFLPLFVVYALVRHRLFDLDRHIRRSFQGGILAGTFVAVFFLVSEGAQTMLADQWGPLVGVLGAGLLVFALSPLQRLSERMAAVTLPNARPIRELGSPERRDIFLEQARIVWADGTISRKERHLLDELRTRLGLSLEAAHGLEREAMRVEGVPGAG